MRFGGLESREKKDCHSAAKEKYLENREPFHRRVIDVVALMVFATAASAAVVAVADEPVAGHDLGKKGFRGNEADGSEIGVGPKSRRYS